MADPKTKTPDSLVGMLKWNPASGKWFVWDGEITGSVSSASEPYAIRMDDGATYLYVGKAVPGSATASAVWQIQRITQADTTVVWADGDASFNNVWDNHAALSYS